MIHSGVKLYSSCKGITTVPGTALMGWASFKNIFYFIDVKTTDTKARFVPCSLTRAVTANDEISAIKNTCLKHDHFGRGSHFFSGCSENLYCSGELALFHELCHGHGTGKSCRTLTVVLTTMKRFFSTAEGVILGKKADGGSLSPGRGFPLTNKCCFQTCLTCCH